MGKVVEAPASVLSKVCCSCYTGCQLAVETDGEKLSMRDPKTRSKLTWASSAILENGEMNLLERDGKVTVNGSPESRTCVEMRKVSLRKEEEVVRLLERGTTTRFRLGLVGWAKASFPCPHSKILAHGQLVREQALPRLVNCSGHVSG